jgi:hypothetical protein
MVSNVKACIPVGKFKESMAEYFQPGARVINGVIGVGVGVGVGVPPPPFFDLEQAPLAKSTNKGRISRFFFI